jgi:hypothetical protein
MDQDRNKKGIPTPRDHSPASTLRGEEYGPGCTPPLAPEAIFKAPTKSAEDGVLTRTLSRFRTKDATDPTRPPPDGGVTAWSQAFLCHLVLFKYTSPPHHIPPSH